MRKIFFNGKVYTGEMPLQDSFIVEDNKFIYNIEEVEDNTIKWVKIEKKVNANL